MRLDKNILLLTVSYNISMSSKIRANELEDTPNPKHNEKMLSWLVGDQPRGSILNNLQSFKSE